MNPQPPSDDFESWLQAELDGDPPEEARQRFASRQAAFMRHLRRQGDETKRLAWPFMRLRLAWLGGTGLLLLIVVAFFIVGRGTPTWAEVNKTFGAAPFINATIYYRPENGTPVMVFELWVGTGGGQRLLVNQRQMIFARDGDVLRSFDLPRRRTTEPDAVGRDILKRLKGVKQYSLGTIMYLFPGRRTDAAAPTDGEPLVSGDLAIFDLQNEDGSRRTRIWALRGTRLPVRIRSLNRANGERVDAMINYAPAKRDTVFDPDQFFSPDAFEARLANPTIAPVDLNDDFLKN